MDIIRGLFGLLTLLHERHDRGFLIEDLAKNLANIIRGKIQKVIEKKGENMREKKDSKRIESKG